MVTGVAPKPLLIAPWVVRGEGGDLVAGTAGNAHGWAVFVGHRWDPQRQRTHTVLTLRSCDVVSAEPLSVPRNTQLKTSGTQRFDWSEETSMRWSDVRMDEGTPLNRAMLALVPRSGRLLDETGSGAQPSMIQRGSSGSGMCSTHATSPRRDQYNIVAGWQPGNTQMVLRVNEETGRGGPVPKGQSRKDVIGRGRARLCKTAQTISREHPSNVSLNAYSFNEMQALPETVSRDSDFVIWDICCLTKSMCSRL